MAITNLDSDFEKWYKRYYQKDYQKGDSFEKIDTMSNEEWQTGNNLFEAYTKKTALDNQYQNSQTLLQNQKNKAMEDASIKQELFNKYLPTYLKQNGLNNLGITPSIALEMQANYDTNVGNIKSDFEKQQLDLLNNYQTSKANVDSEAISKNNDLFNYYLTQNNQSAYNGYANMIEDASTTTRALEDYYNSISKYLNDAQKAEILGNINNLSSSYYNAFKKELESKTNIDDINKLYEDYKDYFTKSQQSEAEKSLSGKGGKIEVQQKIDEALSKSNSIVNYLWLGNGLLQDRALSDAKNNITKNVLDLLNSIGMPNNTSGTTKEEYANKIADSVVSVFNGKYEGITNAKLIQQKYEEVLKDLLKQYN